MKKEVTITLTGYSNCDLDKLLFLIDELEIEETYTNEYISQDPSHEGVLAIESVISDNLYITLNLEGDFNEDIDDNKKNAREVLQDLLRDELIPKILYDSYGEIELDRAYAVVSQWESITDYSGKGVITFVKSEDLNKYTKGESENDQTNT
jgi:hypothetical protein